MIKSDNNQSQVIGSKLLKICIKEIYDNTRYNIVNNKIITRRNLIGFKLM